MTKKSPQNGFTSIIVCLLIMIILSLITIGFAQIMGREQRAALDRQLSTQAFYAAESGVNDASLELAANPSYTKLNDCEPVQLGGTTPINKEIDAVGPVRSTCVNVDPTPQNILLSSISTNQNNPVIMPMNGIDSLGNPALISRIEIRWTQAVGNSGASPFRPSGQTWPAQNDWASRTGVLKVGVVPFSNNTGRAQILDRFSEFYLNPTAAASGTGTVTHISGTRDNIGRIVDGICILATSTCTVSITGIPSYSDLKIVMSSIYRGNSVEILAFSALNVPLRLTGSQAAIDSTGRSGDVLRRISVRKPLSAGGSYEGSNGNALISSGDICKLISANTADTSNSPCGSLGNPRGL